MSDTTAMTSAANASGIRIRATRTDDLAAIRDIYNHYVRTSTVTFDEEETELAFWAHKHELLAQTGLPFLTAEDEGGAVLGFAYAQHWRAKSAYRFSAENTIYLSPEAAGRGLGKALLEALLEASAAAGLREIIAVIEPTAAAASIALHRRYGFVDAGHLRNVGVKFGRSLDVLFLQKSL
ncbi:phosphinothricin acetyltransferase [Microbacterium azadirachtae]|uniref:Phosphinothricin acetyltransferase n=1 Tax=Microbacterium azadirachtae TaxID=582680 RepID=A0A1I6GHD8_9MICO|nr:GNAT family N-acetyltransferase [Microbacterium azadirachtae]SFR41487.1 phosphinothricin acetyltransferase [Microbacterium azadirachtae]